MNRLTIVFITIFTTICLVTSVFAAKRDVDMLAEYFDMLASNNIESAGYLWAPECQERASRFGITYENIPLKMDCTSPIVRELTVMRDYLQPPAKNVIKLPGRFSRMEYAAVVGGKNITHSYYARKLKDYYWLAYAQDFYSQGWSNTQSKYFDIVYHPDVEKLLNPIALLEADNFVEMMAQKLDYSDADLALLEDKKIRYYFCEEDKTVENIIGHLVKGSYDMASGDIISAFFPHYHELTHFLINYKLRSLPLYTLPLFREGIAVYYGGRWGKATQPLESLAAYLYKMEFVAIDSILTIHDFEKNAQSDIAYPVAALFSRFLIEKKDINAYLELYRQLSMDIKLLYTLTADDVQAKIINYTGDKDWESLLDSFNKFTEDILRNKANIKPGVDKKGNELFANGSTRMTEHDGWISVTHVAIDSMASGDFVLAYTEELNGFRSAIFEDQYKTEKQFENHRFGIRMDKNEAGVYDYATNTLVAKYIWGIDPQDNYFDATTNTVTFKFKKELLNAVEEPFKTVKQLP